MSEVLTATKPLVEISDLHGSIDGQSILRGVELTLQPGEIAALVGESGCGKTLTALSLLGLSGLSIDKGQICFETEDLLSFDDAHWRSFCGNKVAMIFQDAQMALNPAFTIESQIGGVLKKKTRSSKEQRRQKTMALLEQVEINNPAAVLKMYPSQLSGGMRQRVLIAMALAAEPRLLIADEPTTSLDVTVQKQIIELLRALNQKLGFAILFISHDLAVVSSIADSVHVMYAGRIIESGPSDDVLFSARHPYTQALLACSPSQRGKGRRLSEIEGQLGPIADLPAGCSFAPRCSHRAPACASSILMQGENHRYACIL